MEPTDRNQTAAFVYQRLGWQVRDGGSDAAGASLAQDANSVLPQVAVDMPVTKKDTPIAEIG
jgi:hypothetical protein